MKIIFLGKGQRGVKCLKTLLDSHHTVQLVVTHPQNDKKMDAVAELALNNNIPFISPVNPNAQDIQEQLAAFNSDMFVLGGYGLIIDRKIIDIPRLMTINLHGGKLPEYRGSSPLNWALINGDSFFWLSIIKVDSGVDTGPILLERQFPIEQNDTIEDLHKIANHEFPNMLTEVLRQIENNTLNIRGQDKLAGGYWPLRFPEDGLFFFDQLSAKQVHNLVRGLTTPYPCARTFLGNRMVKILKTELCDYSYHGTPGRVYKIGSRGFLTCASDSCLWISNAVYADNNESIMPYVKRYDSFTTLRLSIADILKTNKGIS